LPPPVPHRSGRARLTHPAPHIVASPHDSTPSRTFASLPSEVSLRRSWGSMSPASFPPKVPTIRRPLPSTGSLRVGSPASSVLLSAPTPCHPSPQASSPSPSDTASAPTSLLPSPGECIPKGGIRKRSPALPLRLSFGGDDRASQVPGGPQCLHALLFDPGGTLTPLLTHARMLPSAGSTASTPATILSRLNHTACRPPVYASQPGLPQNHATLGSGCQHALPGRTDYLPGPIKEFQRPLDTSPPSRLGLAHSRVARGNFTPTPSQNRT